MRTLESIAAELPRSQDHFLFGNILVVVVKANKWNHREYHEVKRMFQDIKFSKRSYFEFVDQPKNLSKRSAIKIGNIEVRDKPDFRVRKQSLDIVNVILSVANKSQYYMFIEDNIFLCPFAFYHVHHMLSKATDEFNDNWLSIRASFGMNEILLHNSDLKFFSYYLLLHFEDKTPDLLMNEWYMGHTKIAMQH